MSASIFDIFKIGIGPSSSHTMGPMTAACRFSEELRQQGMLGETTRVEVYLYGSLASTGRGHCTDRAVVLGLQGRRPEGVPSGQIHRAFDDLAKSGVLHLCGEHPLEFDPETQIHFHPERILPGHVNGMTCEAFSHDTLLFKDSYYSVGGGIVLARSQLRSKGEPVEGEHDVPHEFRSAAELIALCRDENMTVAELVATNEEAIHGSEGVRENLRSIWKTMADCIATGLEAGGNLPGILRVPRRAPGMYQSLLMQDVEQPTDVMSWINLYALAVNEENAAGGRMVTAPTNGAAGIIPAVIRYYLDFVTDADESGVDTLLLAAGAIGLLYKRNASFSGAELGCQGEVGVACSMAAGGLAAALGGSNEQVENAAEIGMEHNLGLTCDPIAGLVQIPCIERNAIGAVKAVNSATIALRGDGSHKVSLDQVIKTMSQTGKDMSSIYKETSRGGLAVNVPEC